MGPRSGHEHFIFKDLEQETKRHYSHTTDWPGRKKRDEVLHKPLMISLTDGGHFVGGAH